MQGDKGVIDYLNKGLRSELTAVSQYWLHYRLQDNWGLGRLAEKSRKESIEEMHHADKFIDRIIFLEGHPNLQTLDPLRIGESPGDAGVRPGGRARCAHALQGSARLLREGAATTSRRTCSRS